MIFYYSVLKEQIISKQGDIIFSAVFKSLFTGFGRPLYPIEPSRAIRFRGQRNQKWSINIGQRLAPNVEKIY